MKKTAMIALAWCAGSSAAFAVQAPHPGREDSRIRYVAYQSGNVVNIWTAIGSVLTIQFSPTETIYKVATNDSAHLKASRAGNFLFLKATMGLKPQPIYVICQRADGRMRLYNFQFETSASAGTSLGPAANVDYTVKFTYPAQLARERMAKARKAEAKSDQRHAKAVLAEAEDEMTARRKNPYLGLRNYAYVARGDKWLAPTMLWDNGYSTVFMFHSGQRLPNIFESQPDGKMEAVNETPRDGSVTVQGTARTWWLIEGQSVLKIRNKWYRASNPTPGTGTISPNVQLVLKKDAGNE